MFIRILPLGLVVLAVMCVLVAALTPVSRAKGRLRLAGSLSIGAVFFIGSVPQIFAVGWPAVIGTFCGVFLAWVGLRKYRRDPEGRSPSAQIL